MLRIMVFPSRNPIAMCLFFGLIAIALAQKMGLCLLKVEAVVLYVVISSLW